MSRIGTYALLFSALMGLVATAGAQDIDVAQNIEEESTLTAAPEEAVLVETQPSEGAAALETPALETPAPGPRLGAAWEHRFSNGLHLVGRQDPRHERSAICIKYRAGYDYAPPGSEGLALLTQAVHHNGITPRFPEGVRARFESTTRIERDVSGFCIEVPDAELEEVLHAEAARMAYLLHSLTEEHVRAEQERLVAELSPQSPLSLATQRALEGHAPRTMRQETLEGMELSDVQWFHQQHYTPDNAAIAIVSRRPQEEVVALAARYFEGVRGLPAPPPSIAEPPMDESVHIDVTGHLPRRVYLYWQTPAHFAEGDAAMDVIAGHLRQKLRRELRSAALRIHVQQHSGSVRSFFGIGVEAPNNVDLEALASRVETLAIELSRRPLREAEMRAACNSFVGQDPSPGARAWSLAQNALRSGRLISAEANQQRLESLSAFDIRSAAERFLSGPHVRVLYRHAPQPESVLVRGMP